jgi:propanol-preferring alcohol dehydrogenase
MSSPSEAERMLEVVAKNKITVTSNAFDGLEKVPELIELAHSGKMTGKGLIIVDQAQIQAEHKPGIELV